MNDPHSKAATIPETFLSAGMEWWRLWSDFGSRMMHAGAVASPMAPPAESARQLRSSVFQALAETTDEYLRSPQFLETMRFSMGQMVDFRRQLNEFLGRVHHELQGVSRQDLDQLMDALNHVERRVADNCERLTEQLQVIQQRLDAIQPLPRTSTAKPKAKHAKAKAKAKQ